MSIFSICLVGVNSCVIHFQINYMYYTYMSLHEIHRTAEHVRQQFVRSRENSKTLKNILIICLTSVRQTLKSFLVLCYSHFTVCFLANMNEPLKCQENLHLKMLSVYVIC